ncbi:MAG TPA: molybdopterin-dependent oxidoreductase, partial [Caldilineaceae bacterium]|nr:molybdopterin-dependent oxidoreductase [Caldilineaceae bacterium]
MIKISPSEITPEHIFLSRRKFMVGAGSLAVGALALSACDGMPSAAGVDDGPITAERLEPTEAPAPLGHEEPFASATADELGDPLNDYEQITNYNNFYEFSLDKGSVNPLSRNFNTVPWDIEVTGLVNNPQTFALEDILTKFTQEERIYRLRCVEAWSMVIPWVGFPVGELIKEVDPTSAAKFVKFTTVMRP